MMAKDGSAVARILNNVVTSVKIFSIISAAMGVVFIFIAIIGMSIDGGAQAHSFVSRSAGLPLLFLIVVAALFDIAAAAIGLFFALRHRGTEDMGVPPVCKAHCYPVIFGAVAAVAAALELWALFATFSAFKEIYTELWSAHVLHAAKTLFIVCIVLRVIGLVCKLVGAIRLCQDYRAIRRAQYAIDHNLPLRELETRGLVPGKSSGPDWDRPNYDEDHRPAGYPAVPGAGRDPVMTPERFEACWMDMADTGAFQCSLGYIPHLEVLRGHLETQGFRVIASGSLEQADGSQVQRMFFFKVQGGPEHVSFLARFEFTKSSSMVLEAVFKCSVPEKTSSFVQSLRLRHVIEVLD